MLPVMLALLLAILMQSPASGVAKALFVVHLGLFIIWQPFVEGGQRLSTVAVLGMLVMLVGLAVILDARVLMLWIMLLAGVVGGKVMLSGARTTRLYYLAALGFIVLALLLLATPAAFPEAKLPIEVTAATHLGLVFLLFMMLSARQSTEGPHAAEIVDFVNSVFVFLLLAVVVLGSLASMLLFKRDYAESLFDILLLLGSVLLVLGWVWNPHGGFSGVGEFFSRYVMSIGLPAEQWLQALADHAVQEEEPDHFIGRSLADMANRLTWLGGVRWKTSTGSGQLGDGVGRATPFTHLDVTVVLYTSYSLSPSLAWHFQLLVQLLGEFHADKLRARQLKELSYLQAVHETGARLTHDVKNLLQSLQTLCHAAEQAEAENSPEFRALLRRQLPALANRLGATLAKLKVVQDEPPATLQPVGPWWTELCRRYAHANWIGFRAEFLLENVEVPTAVFSSVVENLLGNIEEKKAGASGLCATVSLGVGRDGVRLTVCDDGIPVPAEIAGRLLLGPVPSENGLGIGLFQVGRLAAGAGYGLVLAANERGRVCFELRPLSTAGTRAAAR